jgi:hypothetical protein
VHIVCLFSSISIYGAVPDDFLRGTIIPISKSKNSKVNNSYIYRGITFSSVFGRILDGIVFNRYVSMLVSSELQFGFKLRRSIRPCVP